MHDLHTFEGNASVIDWEMYPVIRLKFSCGANVVNLKNSVVIHSKQKQSFY